MARYKAGPGRPNAGPRRAILTRLDIEVADLVKAEAEARGMSHSAYVAVLVAQAHGIPTQLPARRQPVPEQTTLDTLSA